MDNKAQGEGMEWLVNLIIIVVVILVVGAGMFLFLKYEGWKIFPDFEDDDIGSIDDIVIEEGVVVKFEEPQKVVYEITGRETDSLFYNCNNVEGWKWYVEEIKTWRKVSSIESITFKEFNIKNQNLIKSLQEKSCEEGLALLAERVKKNDEGNWINDVKLIVTVGEEKMVFGPDSEIFEDIRFLIKKINMMGEG